MNNTDGQIFTTHSSFPQNTTSVVQYNTQPLIGQQTPNTIYILPASNNRPQMLPGAPQNTNLMSQYNQPQIMSQSPQNMSSGQHYQQPPLIQDAYANSSSNVTNMAYAYPPPKYSP